MSTNYPHLTNGDVANLLSDHRLTQVHPRSQRYANDPCPAGDGLIALVKERLIAVVDKVVAHEAPEVVRMTPEAAMNNVATVTDLDTLTAHYADLLIEAAPLAAGNELSGALGDLKSRVLTAVAATIPPVEKIVEVAGPEVRVEVPAAGPTDADLVARYNGINSFEQLEEVLSAGHGEEVLLALVGMADRIRASVAAAQAPVEKAVEEPAPEQAAEQQ